MDIMSKSKLFVSLLATAAIFFGASSASAVEYSIVGPTSFTGAVGDQFTINIIQRNASESAVQSVGASVYDYEGVATFDEGEAVDGYLFGVCFPTAGCFNGLDNLAGGALVESSIGANGNRVQIALSASLEPNSNDGSIDTGLDGETGTTQFSLTFTLASSGEIEIGTGYEGDGVVLPGGVVEEGVGTTFTVTVPEPAAMLAGMTALGSVLAIAGIRRKS